MSFLVLIGWLCANLDIDRFADSWTNTIERMSGHAMQYWCGFVSTRIYFVELEQWFHSDVCQFMFKTPNGCGSRFDHRDSIVCLLVSLGGHAHCLCFPFILPSWHTVIFHIPSFRPTSFRHHDILSESSVRNFIQITRRIEEFGETAKCSWRRDDA